MGMKGTEAMEGLIKHMAKTKSNEEFLDVMAKIK
jgi:transcription termination factor Rho